MVYVWAPSPRAPSRRACKRTCCRLQRGRAHAHVRGGACAEAGPGSERRVGGTALEGGGVGGGGRRTVPCCGRGPAACRRWPRRRQASRARRRESPGSPARAAPAAPAASGRPSRPRRRRRAATKPGGGRGCGAAGAVEGGEGRPSFLRSGTWGQRAGQRAGQRGGQRGGGLPCAWDGCTCAMGATRRGGDAWRPLCWWAPSTGDAAVAASEVECEAKASGEAAAAAMPTATGSGPLACGDDGGRSGERCGEAAVVRGECSSPPPEEEAVGLPGSPAPARTVSEAAGIRDTCPRGAASAAASVVTCSRRAGAPSIWTPREARRSR